MCDGSRTLEVCAVLRHKIHTTTGCPGVGLGFAGPAHVWRSRETTRGQRIRCGGFEYIVPVPGSTGHHEDFSLLGGGNDVGVERPRTGENTRCNERVECVSDPGARGILCVDGDLLVAGYRLQRTPARPEEVVVDKLESGGSDKVSGMLRRNLLAECRILVKGCRHRVTELVLEGLVIPQHGLCDVVFEAVQLTADGALTVDGAKSLLHVPRNEVSQILGIVERATRKRGHIVR